MNPSGISTPPTIESLVQDSKRRMLAKYPMLVMFASEYEAEVRDVAQRAYNAGLLAKTVDPHGAKKP